MIKDGFLWCDKCGKPIHLVSGMQFFFDSKNEYCSRCAAAMIEPPPTPPYTLFQRIIRWFKGY
jgi:hypothetical protein